MKRIALAVIALVTVGWGGFAQTARAADPTGTWKWSVTFNDQTREISLKLKLEGDKLTGSMPGRNNQEVQIENGTFKGDEVSFSITREFNDRKFTSKYNGKLDGDTIKGKVESPGRDGQSRTRDWEAKREK